MLNEAQIKNSKPKDKKYLLNDSKGLYLRVDPSGRKYWLMRFKESGKSHEISLGVYPDVNLIEARKKRDELQSLRARGELISIRPDKSPATFQEAAAEWLKVRMRDKAESYIESIKQRLRKYILPAIGNLKLTDIKSPVILKLCRKIENQNFIEAAHKVREIIGQVFRFSIASGYCDYDPTPALKGALTPRYKKHYATLTDPSEIAILMRSIKAYPFDLMRLAMLFSIYTAARPGEIRHAEWSEIKGLEFDPIRNQNPVWDIPAEKMKMKRRHIIPLSRQVIEVVTDCNRLTGNSRYLFPSPRDINRPMSENGVRVALHSLGFTKEQITPHGFRAMFSTIANEHEFNRDVIERQLAHVPENSIRGAYNHAEYLKQRIELMQWWADWLDGLV